jgi:hypothetical protein
MRCGFHHAFGAILMTGAELKFLAERLNPQPALQLLAALSSQAHEIETFIAAEHFILGYFSGRERKRWHLRQKCPRNLRLQPEALPPWTEKNSLR